VYDWQGKSPEDILENPPTDQYVWHIFQARSWLDYATRENAPSAIHYAALELRYGIEYLLFQLLVLISESLTEQEYKRAIGRPHEMKKMLASPIRNYAKLAEFTETIGSVDANAPPLQFWNLDDLFRDWGTASEYLHFCGPHVATYSQTAWVAKAIARLDSVLDRLWSALTSTVGIAAMRPSQMEPEVRKAWEEFKNDDLKRDDLFLRLKIMQPALRMRRGEQGWRFRGSRFLKIPKD
jgi:hypothetical protein